MNRIKRKMESAMDYINEDVLYVIVFTIIAVYLVVMSAFNFSMSRKLGVAQNEIDNHNKTIKALNVENVELQKILDEKDITISELKEDINLAKGEIERLSKPKPIEKKVVATKVSKLKFNEDIMINTKSGKPTLVKKEILNSILKYSKMYNVDPAFIAGMIYVESRFNPKAVNTIHYGLGQVNNTVTGPWLHKLSKASGTFSKDRLFDIDYNIQLTTSYVGYLLKKYKGNILLAMKEYSGNSKVEGAQKYVDDVNRFKSRNLFNFN
ncbi:MAG: transglycosylase SLT domain-containing protein [Peptostreptococcaceae bacterium]